MELLKKISNLLQQRSLWLIIAILKWKDRIQNQTIRANSKIKNQLLNFIPFLIASSICGLVAFLYSQLFTFTEKWSRYIVDHHRIYIFILTPACFILSWWLIQFFSPFSRGSGIPQVMAAIELLKPKRRYLINHFVSFRILVVKIISSAVGLFGGGVLGREGPTIQISSSIFVVFYNLLPSWWNNTISKKNILIISAASGLAAAFNTPLGGILFALEELSKFHVRHFKSTLFVAVIIAGLTARAFGGSYLYLGYPKLSPVSWILIIGIIAVTICGALLGNIMCTLLYRFLRKLRSFKKDHFTTLLIVGGCGLVVATAIYFFGSDVMGSGKDLMERLLFTSDKSVAWYTPLVRAAGMILTFGFGGAGGIFAPSLSCGAAAGSVFSQLFKLSGSDANLLIVIGMTACLSSVTRAPFTTAIIVFEMIDLHSVIFFLMISSILANIISTWVDKHSFYDRLKNEYVDEVNDLTLKQEKNTNTT